MKLLLDENLPHDLRHFLAGHDVFTVAYMGWVGIQNGALLARAAAGGFDALVTLDAGIPYQQNVATLPCALVVLRAPSNRIGDLLLLVTDLINALSTLTPRAIVFVG